MKIILLTLFVLFARVAEAQDYLPMLTNGKEWHCMEDVKYSLRDVGCSKSAIFSARFLTQ